MKSYKQYKNYKDIPSKYKWNLEDILEGKSFDKWLSIYEDIFKQRIENKDSKYSNIDSFLQDLKLEDKQTQVYFKLSNYISNNINTDLTNHKWLNLKAKFDSKRNELNLLFGSEINRFFEHIEKIKVWKEDERLKDYKHNIETLIEFNKHKLSNEVEEYVLKKSPSQGGAQKAFSILTNSELVFEDVVADKNRKLSLSPVTYKKLLKHKDKKVRKQAYQNFAKAYLKHKGLLSELLYQNFKEYQLEAKARNYSSTTEYLTFEDKFNDNLLLNLYDKVSQNSNKLNKYYFYKNKFYKKRFGSKMEKWDVARDLLNVKSSYTIEEAKAIVSECLKPLGQEYNEQIKKAMEENWIDFLSAKGKRGGAYSIGSSYGIAKKYILMNFAGDLRSVGTLAHELGHSLHSYFSDTRQKINNSQYPIFLAEIASVFNELMLYDYLLTTTKSKKARFVLIDNLINNFINTVIKQTEWSNYEYSFLKSFENNVPMNNWNSISHLYYENHQKYAYNKKQKYNEEDLIASIYVPHFYYSFYVYKYAIGHLCASYFFNQYKKEGSAGVEKYINNFLSLGNSDWPLNILAKAGIDFTQDSFYTDSFNYVEELIKEWIELGKELFK